LAAVEEDKGEPAQTIDDDDDEESIIDDEDDEESIIDNDNEESIIDDNDNKDEDEESIIDDIASTFTSLSIKPTTMFSTPTKTPAKKKMMPFINDLADPVHLGRCGKCDRRRSCHGRSHCRSYLGLPQSEWNQESPMHHIGGLLGS
jgi:hypothetical protein